jgi:hypothetical protein
MFDEGLQRMALRDRDVVAADAIPIAKLVDANEVCDRCLQRLSVALEFPRRCGMTWNGGPHICC